MKKTNLVIVIILSTLITYCVGTGEYQREITNADTPPTPICDCPEPPPVELPPPQVTTVALEATLDDTGAGWIPLPDFDPENPPVLSHWVWTGHPDLGDHWQAQGHRGRVYLEAPPWAPNQTMPALYLSSEVPNSFWRVVARYVENE